MKKLLLILTLLLVTMTSLSQLPNVSICLGQDATVCQGQTVTITNCNPGGASIGNGLYMNSPINVNLTDDVYSSVVPIGFSFNFYGNNYTQCVIGSNGLLSFDLGKANGYCAWSLGGAGLVPNAGFTDYRNATMGCYQDMNPGLGGTVQYQTIGTAPNRTFMVLYKDIPMFSCGSCTYMAILLFEGTNNVEYHIGNKPPCPTWNGGLAVQATENNTGTIGHFTPGRNNSVWSANQDGKRYTPLSAINYNVSTIPYILVTSPGTNLQWQNTLGQLFPYNNGLLNVNVVPPGTTGYFLVGSSCGTTIGSVSDTTWLTRVNSTVTATSTPDICSSGIGTVTALPGLGLAPYNFLWPTLGGQTTPTVNNVVAGTYTVQMTDSYGCPSSATVIVGDTPANFTSTSTLVSCSGGSDGTATATMTPLLGNVTYLWSDGQTTQTATNLLTGTYTCVITSDIGCSGTVTATVNEIPPMTVTLSNISNATCNSLNDGMISVITSNGTPQYTYSWDNSTSILNTASDLPAGNNTVTVTDANGCISIFSANITEPTPLVIDSITPPTQICSEDNLQLETFGSGGSSPYTFTWYENGNVIGTGSMITVDPTNTNTQYCVTLSESCGSPTTDTCTVITFPNSITPLVVPSEMENCDGEFYFTNMSSNSSEIATTYFDFSDGTSYLEQGDDSVSTTFDTPNQYSLDVTITSIFGCVYTGTFNNIVSYHPQPEADFIFSNNPTTFFETDVTLSDRSSSDVIDWDWFSPYSSPTTSGLVNPTFNFPQGVVGSYPVTLTVTSEWGCTDTITYMMNVVQDILIYAPSAFTPDGDEHNQQWGLTISGVDVYDFELLIFNRWGEIIWESHDINARWNGTYNGKIVQSGIYIWKATVGDMLNDARYEFNGSVNVLK